MVMMMMMTTMAVIKNKPGWMVGSIPLCSPTFEVIPRQIWKWRNERSMSCVDILTFAQGRSFCQLRGVCASLHGAIHGINVHEDNRKRRH